jgi:AcrR family transcriptional regulator
MRRRGPRPAGSDTREAILQAARAQFGELGYRRTTLRSVAAAVGVDPRLVLHYFGSKRELFMASVELPVDTRTLLGQAFTAGGGSLGERVARGLVALIEEPRTRHIAAGVIRAAASEPEAAALIRQVLTERALLPLTEHLDSDRPHLRASLVASQFVGLVMARYVVGIEPLASASVDEVVAAVGPVFDHYLVGELTGAASPEAGRD